MLDIQYEVVGIYKPVQTSTHIVKLWLHSQGQCSQNQILLKFSEYQLIPNTRYYVAIELYFRLKYANTSP